MKSFLLFLKEDSTLDTTTWSKEGNILSIPDGHHRIHAAKEKGMTHIPSRVIPADALNDKFRRLFL